MRDVLTYLGIGLILVLTALLGAPYVVDFDAHRARFAEEISRATGAEARLDGPIDFRVLPTPYFSARNISLKGPLGTLKAEKAEFELSLPALLQGLLTFTSAELTHFALEVNADLLRRPGASAHFENLTLHDGRISVFHAQKPLLTLEHVDLAGRISNLDGPYDGRGTFRAQGRTIGYSLSSDVFNGDRLPLKLKLNDDLGHLSLDGALDLSGAPSFAGKAVAEGALAKAGWRAEGDVAARPEIVKLDKATLHLGEGPEGAKFAGSAEYGVASGAVSVNGSTPLLAGPWGDVFAGAVLRAVERPAPTALRLQIDAASWRGDWTGVKLARDAGGPLKISAEGAGGSRLDLAAALDAKNVWRGSSEVSTGDYATFAASAGAPVLPFRQVAAGGTFSVSQGTLALSNGHIALDRAKFTGDLAWTAPSKEARGKLTAKLAGTALDPATAPDFFATLGLESDLDLTVDAQTIGKADGRLNLRLLRENGLAHLEQFEAKNLAGADVSASGEWQDSPLHAFVAPKGEARVKANDLADLAALLARLAPGDATRLLASRARLLSPANFVARADGGYAFEGQAAATKFSVALDDKSGIALDISAPEAFDLLTQLGAPSVLSPQKLGPGQISLKTQGGARRDITGKATLGKINGALNGTLPRAGALEGTFSLSGDPANLIGGPTGVGKIEGRIETRDSQILLRKIVGERGDARFSGALTLSAQGVSGELDIDKFSAPAFLALTLGDLAPAKRDEIWPSLSFAPVMIDPPRVKLTIHAAEVAPFGGPAKFDLSLAPNALSVAKIEAPAFGGVLRGGFDLRRQAGQATLSGEMFGDGVALKNPAFSAKVGGRLKFAGSGASMAALVSALSGTGSAKITDLTVAGAAPDAPDQVLAAQAANEASFSARDTSRDLDQALAKGDLRVGDGETPLRLGKGELNATRDSVTFSYDLKDLSFALTSALPGRRAELTWSGPWSAPERKLDASGFVNAAAMKALEREQARIAQQREQDRQRKAEVERQRKEDEQRRQAERAQKLQQPAPQPTPPAPAEPAPAR
ncbi:hypothetical protein CCR94_01375 [Rhodoblastus sphagnicola]|uniref:AsmA domain-containing protein n=1 Tax=Rhodoblastus sphagnicola TaxID=333368 RepID=A0A2S6NFZ8_9HYPH|nr:hypothetical protein [Rhodoblastus sphagnicola]MBB4199509.1 hypothetical protein [Rhodoblastus sphagnicola]PPQ33531.1 hypothetical protein CCR94_01375 [Rhodoblastus sphagnicola]